MNLIDLPRSMVFLYTIAAAALIAAFALGWYMVAMPGSSYRGALPPLNTTEIALRAALVRHVAMIAAEEHNLLTPVAYERAARYIESTLESLGYAVRSQRYDGGAGPVRNLEVVLPGRERGSIVIGAHYDSVEGSPGANDNGSGVAAALELARLLRDSMPRHTLHITFFANEEPPYFQSEAMGSFVYARELLGVGEPVIAMFSLETIGYYSERPGSQHYPYPLSWFYPKRGDFLAFVANIPSRMLLHATLSAFRESTQFPSEGVAAPAFIPGVDWSDQWSFWRAGVPALMITDTALYRYPHYHTRGDTPDQLDYERLARVVSGLERTFRTLDARLR